MILKEGATQPSCLPYLVYLWVVPHGSSSVSGRCAAASLLPHLSGVPSNKDGRNDPRTCLICYNTNQEGTYQSLLPQDEFWLFREGTTQQAALCLSDVPLGRSFPTSQISCEEGALHRVFLICPTKLLTKREGTTLAPSLSDKSQQGRHVPPWPVVPSLKGCGCCCRRGRSDPSSCLPTLI
jgi:hypothetical protein